MHLSTVDHVFHFGGRRRNVCAHLTNDAFVRGIGGKSRRRIGDEPIGDKLRKHHAESQDCASMIAGGVRDPSRPLAIHILRTTGWRHPVIAELSEAQIDVLEAVEPWERPSTEARAS